VFGMLALALTGVVAAAPGHFLSEMPAAMRHARFIESPVEFAGSLAVGQAVPFAQMTSIAELQAARAEEEARRGSVGGFVAMAIIGGLAAFVAAPILLYVGYFTSVVSGGGALSALLIAGIVTFVVGAVIFGVGLGLMIATITRNAKVGHNIRVIDRRMRELQKQQNAPSGYQQPYAPQPYVPETNTPLSAPPPPPQGFMNVEPTLELASF
jgi:hypothetical protein